MVKKCCFLPFQLVAMTSDSRMHKEIITPPPPQKTGLMTKGAPSAEAGRDRQWVVQTLDFHPLAFPDFSSGYFHPGEVDLQQGWFLRSQLELKWSRQAKIPKYSSELTGEQLTPLSPGPPQSRRLHPSALLELVVVLIGGGFDWWWCG